MSLSQISCLPFSSDNLNSTDNCLSKIQSTVEFLMKNSTPKFVILAGYWNYLASGAFETNNLSWRRAFTADDLKTMSYETKVSNFLKSISKSDRNVLIMKDIPDLDFNVANCFDLRPFSFHSRIDKCSISSVDFKNRNKNLDDMFSKLERTVNRLHIFDPTPIFCNDSSCNPVFNNQPLYFNCDHLNLRGADKVIENMLQNLDDVISPLKNHSL
ncbi:MAG: hypothetical protein EOP04_18295 [Proteobacteria bacterium]|nr:MAG: hypothetical protein EOP04_18295 [Pseudomonadota bacterium]